VRELRPTVWEFAEESRKRIRGIGSRYAECFQSITSEAATRRPFSQSHRKPLRGMLSVNHIGRRYAARSLNHIRSRYAACFQSITPEAATRHAFSQSHPKPLRGRLSVSHIGSRCAACSPSITSEAARPGTRLDLLGPRGPNRSNLGPGPTPPANRPTRGPNRSNLVPGLAASGLGLDWTGLVAAVSSTFSRVACCVVA